MSSEKDKTTLELLEETDKKFKSFLAQFSEWSNFFFESKDHPCPAYMRDRISLCMAHAWNNGHLLGSVTGYHEAVDKIQREMEFIKKDFKHLFGIIQELLPDPEEAEEEENIEKPSVKKQYKKKTKNEESELR